MDKIRAYIYYSERNNAHYYRDFEVVEELPEIHSVDEAKSDIYSLQSGVVIKITPVELDCEQGNSDVWDYDFYKIDTFDSRDYHFYTERDAGAVDEPYIDEKYIAIKKEYDR